ncbi:hypothetical protein MIAR_20270 [Microbacterium arabinogalactanolyticum]|nr:hypothetical protein MIAR_20270 [Microbacterium arabinogalactanolyticum]
MAGPTTPVIVAVPLASVMKVFGLLAPPAHESPLGSVTDTSAPAVADPLVVTETVKSPTGEHTPDGIGDVPVMPSPDADAIGTAIAAAMTGTDQAAPLTMVRRGTPPLAPTPVFNCSIFEISPVVEQGAFAALPR